MQIRVGSTLVTDVRANGLVLAVYAGAAKVFAYAPALLTMSARAGNPSASFALTAGDFVEPLAMSARAGSPSASFDLTAMIPASALGMSARAGSPSAQFALTAIAAPAPRGYVGRISRSPVAMAMTDAGRLALDRAIPDPDAALAVAYDWENAPIEVLRAQATAWGYEPFTTLLGETYERQIMATFGYVCEHRNKWVVLDDFFDALSIIYQAEIVGLNGVRYAVDRQAGYWGGYDVTRARELWLLVTLPPGIPVSDTEFIAYLAHAVRWLMPYFRHFVFLVFVNERINAEVPVHTGVGVAATSYLEAVQA